MKMDRVFRVAPPATVSPIERGPGHRAEPAPAASRLGWLDAARAMGIILVVVGHALGGLIDAAPTAVPAAFRQVFFAIYTFHMPLFFVLSGLLIGPRLQRGAWPFLRRLGPTLVWPYFLWSALQFSVIAALGGLVNRPAGPWWPTILALPWHTVSQFWFLHALFWMHVGAAIVVPRMGARALLGLGLAAKMLGMCVVLPLAARFVATNLAWYALGVLLGHGLNALHTPTASGLNAGRRHVVPALLQSGGRGAAMLAGAGCGVALLIGFPGDLAAGTGSSELARLAWRPAVVPVALVAGAAVIALAGSHAWAGNRALAYIGQRTMAIFLLHVLFVAGARIVLVRFGVLTDPVALVGPLVVLGLAGPLLVERIAQRAGVARWLGF